MADVKDLHDLHQLSLKRSRIKRVTKDVAGTKQFGERSKAYLTGVMTYLAWDFVQSAAEQALEQKRGTIQATAVAACLAQDQELFGALPCVAVLGRQCHSQSMKSQHTAVGRMRSHDSRIKRWKREFAASKIKVEQIKARRAALKSAKK
jgi:histone H3/H4